MMLDSKNKGMKIAGILHFTARETIELCENGAVLVDIREEYETAARQFSVKNLIFLPNSEFNEHFNELPKDKFLIFADSVGLRSKEAVKFLLKNGFDNIGNLAGGIVDWERGGYKVITDSSEMLHGQCTCMLRTDKGKKIGFK